MALHKSTPLAPVALTATRYSRWVNTLGLPEFGMQVGCVGTGSPVGTWSFQGSNDPVVDVEYANEAVNAAAIGASSTAETFAMPTTTVNGSALAISGSSATASYVAWCQGLPRYVRAVFTSTSGGSASSLGHAYASGKEFR